MIEIIEDGNNITGLEQPGDVFIFNIHANYVKRMTRWTDSTIRRTLKHNDFTRREQNAIISFCHKIRLREGVKRANWMLTPVK